MPMSILVLLTLCVTLVYFLLLVYMNYRKFKLGKDVKKFKFWTDVFSAGPIVLIADTFRDEVGLGYVWCFLIALVVMIFLLVIVDSVCMKLWKK